MPLRSIAILALCLASGFVQTTPPAAGTLLVLAKADLTLSAVDPATLKVLWTVPSGPDPHEVIASSDGRTAYISNYGGGAFNTITVIDLVARKPLPLIELGALRGPHGLMFAGGKLYFTAEGAKIVGRYDPATRQVDLVLGTGQNRTHMVLVNDDGTRIVASNVGSASLTFLEPVAAGRGQGPGRGGPTGAPPAGGAPGRGAGAAPPANWDATVVKVGPGAEGFDQSPDGKEIWAANAQDGTVSVVDVASKAVTQTLAANVTGANRLKFTPDGSKVLVSTLRGPDVIVFDAASKREIKRIPVGTGAAGIQMQPDGTRAFIACTPDSYVSIIDLRTLTVAGKLEAGRQPDGMAWAGRP